MKGQVHGEDHGAERKSSTIEIFDHEIDLRGIAKVGIWLAVITVASFAASWLFYRGLASYERRTLDVRPSPIREASAPRPPAGPLLQISPESDLAAFRSAEQQRLAGWGWVDEGHGVAHVPVDKAIEVVAAHGLPSFAPPTEAVTP